VDDVDEVDLVDDVDLVDERGRGFPSIFETDLETGARH
jgi:hypothetical protein